MLTEIYKAIKEEEIVMPAEQVGLGMIHWLFQIFTYYCFIRYNYIHFFKEKLYTILINLFISVKENYMWKVLLKRGRLFFILRIFMIYKTHLSWSGNRIEKNVQDVCSLFLCFIFPKKMKHYALPSFLPSLFSAVQCFSKFSEY
jgi:hypothetical protein